MDFETLNSLVKQNDVTIVDHGTHRRTPPHYFDSLRNALGFYFSTFNTQNASYDYYAEGLSKNPELATSRDFIDEENTVLAIVSFERFFELFLKNLLSQANENLSYSRAKGRLSTEAIISEMGQGVFIPKRTAGSLHMIPFSETLDRFYDLIKICKQGSKEPIAKSFSILLNKHPFLDSADHLATFRVLNSYRNRILHNGDRIPSLWMLDYFVTQLLIPIVSAICAVEKELLHDSLFYFTTLTNIDIIERLSTVKYEFGAIYDSQKEKETFRNLTYIGHLKELGRANLNMNLYMRNNTQATYEYNYKDPQGRGRRFAKVECLETEPGKKIITCMCCGQESMVVYQETIVDVLNFEGHKQIEWVKCYTCDYHLRYNAGDPYLFGLSKGRIFGQ